MNEPLGRAHLAADHARHLAAPDAGVLPRALGPRRIALMWAALAAVLGASAAVWFAPVRRTIEFVGVGGAGGIMVLLDDTPRGVVQVGQRVETAPGGATAAVTAVDELATSAAALRERFGIPPATTLPATARVAWIALPNTASPPAPGSMTRLAIAVGHRRAAELIPVVGPLFAATSQ